MPRHQVRSIPEGRARGGSRGRAVQRTRRGQAGRAWRAPWLASARTAATIPGVALALNLATLLILVLPAARPVSAEPSRLPLEELPGRISIVVGEDQVISPEEARVPSLVLDPEGALLVVDHLRGFLVGRFRLPAEFDPSASAPLGGVTLEAGGLEGPPLPDSPLTPLPAQAGFPFLARGPLAGGVCLSDGDGDGTLELFTATTDGYLYRIDARGDRAAGWPRRLNEPIYAPPAAGDLDADGIPEIVLGSVGGLVHVWDTDGRAKRGWPRLIGHDGFPTGSIFGAPALADLDGEPGLEVCIGTSTGLMAVLDSAGEFLPGWPQVLPPATNPPNPAGLLASPAAADLDGDGRTELVAATNAGQVHVWRADGHPLPGWPVALPDGARAGYGDVAIGDITGDGRSEIVVTSERGLHGQATVSVLDAEGRMLPGWPFELSATCNAGAALGDVNGDGRADVVVATIGGDAAIYALDGLSSRPLANWPVYLRNRTINASPLLADLDGDGGIDVLVAALSAGLDSRASIWAFDAKTAQIPGFPILLPGDEIIRATPTVMDLDRDGDLELIAVTELLNSVHVWDLQAACDPERLPWPSLSGGCTRVGLLGAEPVTKAPSPRQPERDPSLSAASPLTAIGFELKASTEVQLVIFDIHGHPIRRLLDTRLPPGRYQIRWDGQDDRGQERASGIYFYQLSLEGRATTRQLLLLH